MPIPQTKSEVKPAVVPPVPPAPPVVPPVPPVPPAATEADAKIEAERKALEARAAADNERAASKDVLNAQAEADRLKGAADGAAKTAEDLATRKTVTEVAPSILGNGKNAYRVSAATSGYDAKEVRADSEQDARAAYLASLGVWQLPHAIDVQRV